VVLVSPEKRVLEESNTVALIDEIKAVLTVVVLLGLFPYLWYRDRIGAWVSLIGFVVIMGIWIICIIESPWPKKIAYGVLAIGASCNQLAIWANHGKMPVKNVFEPHGLWRPMVDSDKLKFLCDIYWGSTSIGDLIAVGGFILIMIASLV
jgi:hypothetical protein